VVESSSLSGGASSFSYMSEAGPFIALLLARLERISADSPLAHRASGVRGALLRSLEAPATSSIGQDADLTSAIDAALDILTRAAADMRPGPTVDPFLNGRA
jgi:hypothetical protein